MKIVPSRSLSPAMSYGATFRFMRPAFHGFSRAGRATICPPESCAATRPMPGIFLKTPDPASRCEFRRLYWHFVDVVWLFPVSASMVWGPGRRKPWRTARRSETYLWLHMGAAAWAAPFCLFFFFPLPMLESGADEVSWLRGPSSRGSNRPLTVSSRSARFRHPLPQQGRGEENSMNPSPFPTVTRARLGAGSAEMARACGKGSLYAVYLNPCGRDVILRLDYALRGFTDTGDGGPRNPSSSCRAGGPSVFRPGSRLTWRSSYQRRSGCTQCFMLPLDFSQPRCCRSRPMKGRC